MKESKEERVLVKMTKREKELLLEASNMDKRDMTSFVRKAIEERANHILGKPIGGLEHDARPSTA